MSNSAAGAAEGTVVATACPAGSASEAERYLSFSPGLSVNTTADRHKGRRFTKSDSGQRVKPNFIASQEIKQINRNVGLLKTTFFCMNYCSNVA